jgi:PIN domain nuclease of toxin-antitoxin system
MLLLDTCTFLWLVSDQRRLSGRAKKAVEANPESLFISSISAFEIAIKNRNKKLTLPLPAADWFAEAVDFHGIREVPVTIDIAIRSAELPPLHNDPCDRIIIATAIQNSMRIITPDHLIAQYDKSIVLW